MVEYILYKVNVKSPFITDHSISWYSNGEWINSIYKTYNKFTERTIVQNTKELLLKNNCPFGKYNINLIRGPKSMVMSWDDYECCVGYANIEYTNKGIIIVDFYLNEDKN